MFISRKNFSFALIAFAFQALLPGSAASRCTVVAGDKCLDDSSSGFDSEKCTVMAGDRCLSEASPEQQDDDAAQADRGTEADEAGRLAQMQAQAGSQDAKQNCASGMREKFNRRLTSRYDNSVTSREVSIGSIVGPSNYINGYKYGGASFYSFAFFVHEFEGDRALGIKIHGVMNCIVDREGRVLGFEIND
jgi:hypothetical protein